MGMESMILPRPPPLNPFTAPKSSTSGFRLLDHDDTGSVYSVYKQKIDAMFESDSSSTKNSVQARIERMFTDVAIDNGIPVNDIGCHNFSVDYLGSIPLLEKVTSLAGLQKPLKDLYFAYKRNSKYKQALTGRLEISASGLKVQYQGDKGDLEQLNSFPTIAVWSAVKFVLNEDSNSSFAFLPLITDPDNIDKQQLFKALDSSEKKYIGPEAHSPLFAVVMRKIGVHKQLECHGFVCQTSEDAIVIAATLYKSLMAHMKAKEKKPKNRNGVTCMSIGSTINEQNPQQPVRPPRKKRSTSSSIISDIETIDTETAPLIRPNPKKSTKTKRAPKTPQDLDEILPYEEPTKLITHEPPPGVPTALGDKWNTYKSNNQKQITDEIKLVMSESSNMGLKRVKSVRKRSEEAQQTKENSGDILTKVTIPRSGSFLNAGGLTRYKSKVQRLNGQATGGSPLGFNELFNEFRLQEGLHSMDEILGVIIDPEGMSFNDLKPIYKEFLLKLAVTLTKDELYQRAKVIMRRQKKKLLRRNSSVKKRSVMVCSKLKRLKHVFQKIKVGRVEEERKELGAKIVESSISSSSYNSGQFAPKEKVQAGKKMSYRKREASRRERNSTSEESDFFSVRKSKAKKESVVNHNRNSSSGYVSCSECSFDSDTCTCVSADKCYCSLPQKPKTPQKPAQKPCFCDESLTFCGCDTDSCTDSNKCYCNPATTFQHLKHLGFIPAQQPNLVTPPSNRKLCKTNSNTKSTRSLEYMHNPSEKYYERVGKREVGRDGGYSRMGMDAHFCRESMKSRLTDRSTQKSSLPAGTEALSVKKSAEIAALFADIKLSQTTDVAQIRGLPRFPPTGRVITNSLYSSKNLYSATNGLYTIQSQSDDSSQGKREYFNIKKNPKAISQGALENSLGYLP